MTALLERGELLERLDRLGAEGGRLVFVGGEAGVGKTALVRAFAAASTRPVLSGSCESLTTATPLGPFADLAAQAGGPLAAALARGVEPREVALALLRRLADPALVVLEDVHWADEATLDALRVLGRRIDTTRSLVIATYRDDEVDADHPLRLVLGELATAPAVARLSVPRLSLDAVRELAEPHDADAEAIHRLTQGNAFYVTEILAAGGGTLPETVRDAVLARTARLGPEARGLLEVASLVPSWVELWLLEAVAPAELEHLDECLASGVLREDGDGVAFRHELGRLAVESAVSPNRRRALHSAIVLALEPAGDVSRLAHHAEEAGDSAAVLAYAREAGRRAVAAGAHRQAAAQYARALRHADSLSTTERIELLAAHGQEAQVTGDFENAIRSRTELANLYRQLGDALREGDVLARLPLSYIAPGRNAEAESASARAIELLEPLPHGSELANAYGIQAYLRMLNRDNTEGVAWGERAAALAEEIDDGEALSFALNMIGTSYVMAGETERGIGYLLRSIEVATRFGDDIRVAGSLGMLGSGLGEMYELELSERYLREHIAFCEKRDLATIYSESWLAAVQVYHGSWDEAARLARKVLGGRSTISEITAQIALGRLRARRGDPGAFDALDEALRLSLPGGHLQRLGHVHAARAEAAWLAGDRERALEEGAAMYPLALEKRHLWFAGELAYWQWKAGAAIEAPAWIAEPFRLQLDGAAAVAAAAWRERGCPYEAARALAETGEEEHLLEALAEFERLGAGPATKLARQALRELGAAVPRGPRASTRANPADLTARELDVLRLVAAGRRNAEIADELVLSPRTVDHHVSAILRKLEARTRGEASAAAAQLGLLQDR